MREAVEVLKREGDRVESCSGESLLRCVKEGPLNRGRGRERLSYLYLVVCIFQYLVLLYRLICSMVLNFNYPWSHSTTIVTNKRNFYGTCAGKPMSRM